MGYRQYMPNSRTINQEPLVTIGAGDNIYLNSFLMRNYFVGIKRVILLFDDVSKRFAIKPAKENDKGAYTLGFSSKEYSTGFIAARGFVKLPLVQKFKGRRLKAAWDEREKLLEIKL